jgi:hypothetical protein
MPSLAKPYRGHQNRSRSHDALILVYDSAGNVIETHEHTGDFQRVVRAAEQKAATQ